MPTKSPPVDQAIAQRLAAEVRAEMGRQGLSQQALANRLGWSQARLSRRISTSGRLARFTVEELTSLAATLGVPLNQLLPRMEPAA